MTKARASVYIVTGGVLILLLLGGFSLYAKKNQKQTSETPIPHTSTTATETLNTPPDSTNNTQQMTNVLPFTPPLSRTKERVAKKPFGIRVSPTNSPVSPEKFTGIHTGTDFETFPEEVDTDVPVMTICSGPLLRKQQARGYGGMAVQACTLNDNPITVVYGHLQLASINWIVGNQLTQGATLGILGKGHSPETGGERKHLHLGVHTGSQVVTNGYIANQSDLHNWLDIMQYIQ